MFHLQTTSWIDFLAGFGIVLLFLLVKMTSKFVGVRPLTTAFGFPSREGIYTTLLMSTGLVSK